MRGFSCIGLVNPKNAINIGSVMRAAGVFESRMVVVSGTRFKKVPTDTMKHYRHVPLIQTDDVFNHIPYDCVPVAVELVDGAKSLVSYQHPRSAFYVFGAEDATLGEKTLSRCRDVVYIQMKGCMNLAACVNVVLYDRLAKKVEAS